MKLLLYKVKSGIRIIKNAGLRFFIYYIAEKLHGNTVYYYNEQRIMQDKGLPTSMQEAATNNEGVTITADDVIFFCDENIIPLTKNWFEIMLEALSQPDVGGVTPLQLSDNKTVFNAGILLGTPGLQSFAFKGAVYTESKRLKSKNHIRDVSALSGDCLLIKKDVFNDIGKFDEINIQEGFSDIEISLILREKGYRCVIAPNAIVLNDNKTPIKKSSKPDKSAIYIMEKWGKYLEEDAFFTEELKVLYKIAPPSHIYKYYAPENKAKRKPNARDILFIGNDLQRTGAPIVLLDMVRVVLENGDHPVVISLLDGVLRQEYLDMGITVIIDNSICDDTEESSHTFEAFARNFDLIVVNTLTCGRTISALNNSLPPVLWWIHECPFTIDYFKNFLPDKPGANIFAYSPSNYMANALNNAGLNYDFGRLTYGIYDLSESKAQAEDQEKVLFLMVGSIEYNKGHDIVIRAIEHLDKETLEKVQLTIIGTANDPETIKLCETAAEKYSNITIPGAMPREKLWKWYGKANCVLIPSRQEAFSMVGLEALMLSVPLICSDNVGLAEYITHNENGFIFPSENHIELAKYITFMVKNRDKTTQMGQKARKEIYEEHFTMEKFKGKVLNTIDEVLKK